MSARSQKGGGGTHFHALHANENEEPETFDTGRAPANVRWGAGRVGILEVHVAQVLLTDQGGGWPI
jgi:hypothetical protein